MAIRIIFSRKPFVESTINEFLFQLYIDRNSYYRTMTFLVDRFASRNANFIPLINMLFAILRNEETHASLHNNCLESFKWASYNIIILFHYVDFFHCCTLYPFSYIIISIYCLVPVCLIFIAIYFYINHDNIKN